MPWYTSQGAPSPQELALHVGVVDGYKDTWELPTSCFEHHPLDPLARIWAITMGIYGGIQLFRSLSDHQWCGYNLAVIMRWLSKNIWMSSVQHFCLWLRGWTTTLHELWSVVSDSSFPCSWIVWQMHLRQCLCQFEHSCELPGGQHATQSILQNSAFHIGQVLSIPDRWNECTKLQVASYKYSLVCYETLVSLGN